jgi:hypothetical protein
MLFGMGKNFVSVATTSDLSGVFVSEYDEGALAWSADIKNYLTLQHNVPFNQAVPANSTRPQLGSPVAGSPFACWVAFSPAET